MSNRVWLFQALPEYNLVEKVQRYGAKGDTWTPNTGFRKMGAGDPVLLWQAGEAAGVYSVGWIKAPAQEVRGTWSVDVGYGPLLTPPISKEALNNRSVFDKLKVLGKGDLPTYGTVFPVTDEQWIAFKKLLPEAIRESIAHESQKISEISERLDKAGRFTPADMKDARKRQRVLIALRQGQPQFREQLLQAYEGKCAISGCSIVEALEAAHITPYKGPKTNHPSNGILLRADIHTLFDVSLMAIVPSSFTIYVSKSLSASEYKAYHGKMMLLPKAKSRRPDSFALETAFNRFQTAESMR